MDLAKSKIFFTFFDQHTFTQMEETPSFKIESQMLFFANTYSQHTRASNLHVWVKFNPATPGKKVDFQNLWAE